MNSYFATFPAGTYNLIAKHLKGFKVDELKITENDNSSVVFTSSLPAHKLAGLRYFTNVYLVVDGLDKLPNTVVNGKYFRLMLLKDGSPYQMGEVERAKLEAKIKHGFSLEPNTHLSKNDFFMIERSSGKRLFTLRLARDKFKRDELQAGELRPELAHILCLAAGMKSKYRVVDMFAGYGAIPLETVRGFGCKQVVAVDNRRLPKRHERTSIIWHRSDARSLDFLADDSVDRVVTDPPWGVYDAKVDDLQSLYTDFTAEMIRILKPDGVAVILSGYANASKILEQSQKLKLIGKWNILVSGKKATIYKLQKVR